MVERLADLLSAYEVGCGYRRNDVLRPRDGADPFTFGVINCEVVVLRQDSLAPHQYHVVGEAENPKTPAGRFIKFRINGHDWQRVGEIA